MAQDKRKVVGQNDNETESLRFDYELHALRQKYVRALVQTEGGVVISKPTKSLKTSQVKERSKEKQRGKASKVKRSKEDSSCSLLSHFWSTFRSPFYTCYIPFQRSGSQESNASNRV
ncbi:hypothetical protein CK203_101187 [Vitis vinifera]|uniref:Uncharacterized protein n=1 Tax=Vitis vinifera TaxID=29760 RepID=A0A438EDD9_VITVI|nr:hypothetical protein CK203_101187 [Vitis vinifera]